jgi:hypothetical protein
MKSGKTHIEELFQKSFLKNYCIEYFNMLLLILSSRDEPLAQLVEHLTFNQRVEGSNPSWLTIFILVARWSSG